MTEYRIELHNECNHRGIGIFGLLPWNWGREPRPCRACRRRMRSPQVVMVAPPASVPLPTVVEVAENNSPNQVEIVRVMPAETYQPMSNARIDMNTPITTMAMTTTTTTTTSTVADVRPPTYEEVEIQESPQTKIKLN